MLRFTRSSIMEVVMETLFMGHHSYVETGS